MATLPNSPWSNSGGFATRRRVALADVLLVAIVLLVYLPSLSSQFVRLDDYQYVVDNPLVREPSWGGVVRMFTEVWKPSTVDGYYQPLTMVSLMLDGHLSAHFSEALETTGQPDPFIFHLTNALWHAACAVLVLHLMRACGADLVWSFLLAALFAVHPVQVESVSWVSQRKTVLATALALGSLLCYLRHGRGGSGGTVAASAGLFALAALAKPTVLPLLLVLPLLDWWPLGRGLARPLWTKLPFVAIAGGLGYVAWQSQAGSGATLAAPNVASAEQLGRLACLVVYAIGSYALLLARPETLSPYRPLPDDLSLHNLHIGGFLVAIVVAIGVAFWLQVSAPFVLVCGAAFLLTLTPALGVVRFDEGLIADRFLYLPFVFFLMACAGWNCSPDTRDLAAKVRRPRWRLVLGVALLAVTFLTYRQQGVWRDSYSLWTHVAAVAPDVAKAQYEMAVALLDRSEIRRAVEFAERAAAKEPQNHRYRLTLVQALLADRRPAEAIRSLPETHGLVLSGKDLGWCFQYRAEAEMMSGSSRAADSARKAIAHGVSPETSYSRLGDAALRVARRYDEAVRYYQLAVDRACEDVRMRWNLGTALYAAGRPGDAVREYETVLRQYQAQGWRPSDDMLTAVDTVRRAIADAPTTQPASQD